MTPHILAMIEDELGAYAAERLAARWGGQQVSLPRHAHPNHPIARTVGLAVLQLLVDWRGGEKIEIPLGASGCWARARRRAAELVAGDVPVAQVVRATGIHRRTVFRIKQKRREDDLQPRLL